jgi:hypothetical protein
MRRSSRDRLLTLFSYPVVASNFSLSSRLSLWKAAATTSLDAQDPDPASSSMRPHIQTRRMRSTHWTACRVPEL